MANTEARNWIRDIAVISIILIVALWIMCVIPSNIAPKPPWCGAWPFPLNQTDGDEDEEEEPALDECEDLDIRLNQRIPNILAVMQFVCVNAGMNWFQESTMVGCRDPFIPGRIDCNTVVANPNWLTFANACRASYGNSVCNRKFAGCICNPAGSYECGMSWTYSNGLYCSGTCNKGGTCTQLNDMCFCKDSNGHIICDEYVIEGELECTGYCENEGEWCGYNQWNDNVCECSGPII